MIAKTRHILCIFIVALFFDALPLHAQQKFTLSGYLRDATSGETLIGANIIVEGTGKGTVTNNYGFYSMTLPEGEYTILFSYIGYETIRRKVQLDQKIRLNLQLQVKSIEADEIEIKGQREDKNVESTDMGRVDVPVEKIKTLPVVFGEPDILKTIQLLPGVQSAGEGNAGFYVRGGGPDQNLVLLDEAVVYNTGHLFGFFSVFNADALKNTTLIKGGMPANYGGRLSSVVDITMKEGNNKQFKGSGGIGTIASRLTVEGPLVKDKGSFMISGRRTYIDILLRPFIQGSSFEGTGYYFYDLNAKANYKFSDKDRLYLSGYFGRDVFSFSSASRQFKMNIPWGNSTGTLRWNHLFSDNLFMNVSAVYNDYNFEIGAQQDNFDFVMYSGVRDWNLKTDFTWFPHMQHTVKFGLDYTYHTFIPSSASASAGDTLLLPDDPNKKYAHEAALYALDEFEVTDRLKFNVGVRVPFFQQVGPYTEYEYDHLGRPTDSVVYGAGEPVQFYWGVEPRISGRYRFNRQSSVKASYTFTNQFIHLVANSGTTLPTDIWVPSSARVRPQRGAQYALGYYHNFDDNTYETSLEVFYRDMQNQIEFRDGYVPAANRDIERDFVFGEGRAYGAEVFIKKKYGKFNGWMGYTLSWTTRQFDDLNDGEPFPATYDRRHDLSVVTMYNLNKRWTFGGTFVFATGQATTLPFSRYLVDGVVTGDYGSRNSFRMRPYHRLDLSATLKPKKEKKFNSSWTFSIYNVYSRMNPYFIYFETEGDPLTDLTVTAKEVALFPIIPSVTWNFEF